MKTLLFLSLIASLNAHAAIETHSLDSARALSAKIERHTGGRIQVLNPAADDMLFQDPDVLHKLGGILMSVLHRSQLSTSSAKEVGLSVVEAIDYWILGSQPRNGSFIGAWPNAPVTPPRPEDFPAARARFCHLSTEPCALFSKQIASEICADLWSAWDLETQRGR